MKKVLLIGLAMVFSVSFAIAATVSGVVTDLDTGEALENATIMFCFTDNLEVRGGGDDCDGEGPHGDGNGGNHGGGNGGNHGGCVLTTTTDVNGYYEIADLAEGIYTGKARKHGEYLRQQIEDLEIVEPGITVNFELEPCTDLGGFLRIFGRR